MISGTELSPLLRWIFESASGHPNRPLGVSFDVVFLCGILGCAVGVAGCGNSCFAGFSINGKGGFAFKAGEPPPACSLMPARSMVRLAALKSRVCDACPASGRAEHIYLTVKDVQLRAESSDNAPEWVELAPEFETQPRQFDLIGNSDAETLVQGKTIPAGNFRELRLHFYLGDSQAAAESVRNNVCGSAGWNCIVLADGRVETLRFPDETAELRIPLSEPRGLVLLPEDTVELRLSLLLQQVFVSTGEGLELQNRLGGRATAVRQRSADVLSSPLD